MQNLMSNKPTTMIRILYTLVLVIVLLTGQFANAKHSRSTTCTWSQKPTVNKVFKGVPADLNENVLLVPRYDLIEPNEAMPPAKRKNMLAANRLVKEGNTTINKTLRKSYNYEYKMVSLKHIEEYKAEGYRYFLDVVIMPKQMTEPKKEAMVSSYRKFRSANRMFTNYDYQFHHYFYIRDLQTDDAYITTKFRGEREVYKGMGKFLKRVINEANH